MPIIPPTLHLLEASDLATKTVIVYMDRAEVKRVLTPELKRGVNEIVVQNVSAVIERQSVRVDGRGAGVIQEVLYQELPLDQSDNTGPLHQLERQKAELEVRKAENVDQMSVLRKRIEVLDGVAGQIGSNFVPGTSSSSDSSLDNNGDKRSSRCNSGFLLTEDALNNLSRFLEYYGQTVSEMKSQLRRMIREGEQMAMELELLERQIDQLRCGHEYDNVKRNISILVECEEDVTAELHLSYQVYCAGWKPAYDIRACTDGEPQENTLKVCYYGIVEQNTGESWQDAEILLSTATPSVGGAAPALTTMAAQFYRQSRHIRSRQHSSRRKPNSAASDEDMGFGSFDYNDVTDALALQRLTAAANSLESDPCSYMGFEQVPSTCFSIARPASIASDGTEHKLTIVQIDLRPSFLHESVPARSTNAFLTASAVNESVFSLLPGPAAVYLNNSFVAKTNLRAVMPGEELRCSLGIDPSVKIDYRPGRRAHEQIGFVSKCSLLTHEQSISIRNARPGPLHMVIREQIPKSADDKIKVNVISPDLRSRDCGAQINKDHNLEWTMKLTAGEQKNIQIKYTIEYPINESLTYRQDGLSGDFESVYFEIVCP